jgi:pimeloyl-ACP methyl ester carboxylesterase
VGTSARVFAPILARAEALGRRAIGVDLPGFGRSRREVRTLEPAHVAAQVADLLTSLRITRVDLVAAGFAALVADALATRSPALVRRVVAIDADDAPAREAELALRCRLAASDPEALRARLIGALPGGLPDALRATLEAELQRAPARNLALAYRSRAPRTTPIGVGAPGRIDLDGADAIDPGRIWAALSDAEAR